VGTRLTALRMPARHHSRRLCGARPPHSAEEKSAGLLAPRLGIREPRCDLIVTLTTPPLISLVGTLLKMLRGARHFIWEMDVYPDIAVDLNVLKQSHL
jgi:hypothetical protein